MIPTPGQHTSRADAALPPGIEQGGLQMLMALAATPMLLAHAAQVRTALRTSHVIATVNTAGGGALPTTTRLQAATHPTSLAEPTLVFALSIRPRLYQEIRSP